MPTQSSKRVYPWLGLILCLVTSLVLDYLFLPQQSLWTDEVTQLTGLSLGTKDLFAWLMHTTSDFGVPFDRMPPLSYLMGQSWGLLFGDSVFAYRCLGICCVAAATGLIYDTAYRYFGTSSAIFSGLLFALSPNVIVSAVEIRAYPEFLLMSALASRYLIQVMHQYHEGEKKLSFRGLICACLLMNYTHYFGVVFCIAVFSYLLIAFRSNRSAVRQATQAALWVGLFSLGLIPFIIAAKSLSHDVTIQSSLTQRISELSRMIYRLLSHAALAMNVGVLGLWMISLLGLAWLAIAKRRPLSSSMIGIVGLGLLVVMIALCCVSNFQVATPSYSVWMIPPLFLYLGSGIGNQTGKLARLTLALAILAIASEGYGAFQIVSKGSYFSHGPYERLANLIEKNNVSDAAVVYESDSDQDGMVYFTLYYLFKGKLDQYKIKEGSQSTIVPFSDVKSAGMEASYLTKYKRVYVVKAVAQGYQQLLRHLHEGIQPLSMGPLTENMDHSTEWKQVERETLVAWTALELVLFEKS